MEEAVPMTPLSRPADNQLDQQAPVLGGEAACDAVAEPVCFAAILPSAAVQGVCARTDACTPG